MRGLITTRVYDHGAGRFAVLQQKVYESRPDRDRIIESRINHNPGCALEITIQPKNLPETLDDLRRESLRAGYSLQKVIMTFYSPSLMYAEGLITNAERLGLNAGRRHKKLLLKRQKEANGRK